MIKNKTENIFLSCITSGSKLSSSLLNMSLLAENEEGLYLEFHNNFANLYKDDFSRKVIEKQFFNNIEYQKYYNSDLKTCFIKDQDDVILREISDYLLKISSNGINKIQFWVDNPLDWIFFLQKAFIFKNEIPIIPEYIIPIPNDMNTLLQTMTQKEEKYNGVKTIQDLFPLPDNYMYNSLIKCKYNKELKEFLFN